MRVERILTLIIRMLEDCLEHEYTAEELRSKIRDILRVLQVYARAK
jgi:hypothetical protein